MFASSRRLIFPSGRFSMICRKLSLEPKSATRQLLRNDDIKISKLKNGITVVSSDYGEPVSKLAIYVNAGARYESDPNLGLTHALRSVAHCSTRKFPSVTLCMEPSLLGIDLRASTTREQLIYEACASRDKADYALDYLCDIVSGPEFHWHELETQIERRMCYDGAVLKLNTAAYMTEQLHKACYKNGLSNSLYADQENGISLTSQEVIQFHTEAFHGNAVALVGTGIDHQDLVYYAQELLSGIPKGNGLKKIQSKLQSRNDRFPTSANVVHAALGLPVDQPNVLVWNALATILGGCNGRRVMFGGPSNALLPQAIENALCHSGFGVSATNFHYSDSSLFAVYLTVEYDQAGKALVALRQLLRDIPKFASKHLELAKTQMKSDLLYKSELSDGRLDYMGSYVFPTGSHVELDHCMDRIDKISADEVVKAAQSLSAGNLSTVTTGNLRNVPFLEDL